MGRLDGQPWLEQAKRDLEAAQASAAAGHFEWACFQSQQGAEKALKGFLLMAGKEHQRTHSVADLLDACTELLSSFKQVRPSAELDVYYVSTRYPDALAGGSPHRAYSKDMADKCLSLASSLIEFVMKLTES